MHPTNQAGPGLSACAQQDLSANRISFFAIWGAPLLIGVAVGLVVTSLAWAAGAWSLVLFWMGAACLVNASRCGRLHCYFSGPILFGGAALAGALGAGILDFGPRGLGAIVGATLALAGLTYLIEQVWGRYRR